MGKYIDLTGRRFGRWVVESRADNDRFNKIRWECACDCGSVKKVNAGSLLSGKSTSCGCYQKEKIRHTSQVHGMSTTREYTSYHAMKQRCNNPNNPEYPRYGERGINVCKRWLDSFENFLEDMGPCPKDYTIDRKDNDGNYTPSNCRWASDKEQALNRRTTRTVTYHGVETTYVELCEKFNISLPALNYRLSTGMSLEEALNKPIQVRKHTIPVICLDVKEGKYTIFKTYNEAVTFFNNKESSLRRAIDLKRIYLSKYLIKYSDDSSSWDRFTGNFKMTDDVVIELEDGVLIIFNNICEGLEYLDRNDIDIDSCKIKSLIR